MIPKVSAVINTFNEEKNIAKAIKSVSWADEILVCDMHSTDETVSIAKSLGAKVVFYKNMGFVEPARNFAISKTTSDWILILDADEQIPDSLSGRLQQLVKKEIASNFIQIPRKNILFGKWMKASMWWPDYQVRFFKKGSVRWSDKIHMQPKTEGEGLILQPEEKWAIVHHNYQSISQFVERMNRYTTIEAKDLKNQNYQFRWNDLIQKPLNEFLSRFFANRGYEDGIHGFATSLLQGFSFVVVYLKVWEFSAFKEESIKFSELDEERNKAKEAINYWMNKIKISKNPFKSFLKSLQNN